MMVLRAALLVHTPEGAAVALVAGIKIPALAKRAIAIVLILNKVNHSLPSRPISDGLSVGAST